MKLSKVARRRAREHRGVFSERDPARSQTTVAAAVWGVRFAEWWAPPTVEDEPTSTAAFRAASDARLHPDVLRHELFLVAVRRLETVNRYAAAQFLQDYAAFTLTLETVHAAGSPMEPWAELCLDRLRTAKVIQNKRDQVRAPEALRALALMQYERILPAIQTAQRESERFPAAEREAHMGAQLSRLLAWMGPEGQRKCQRSPNNLHLWSLNSPHPS
jgi:hypothetical protein